mgnify:CR=1 FL=1
MAWSVPSAIGVVGDGLGEPRLAGGNAAQDTEAIALRIGCQTEAGSFRDR